VVMVATGPASATEGTVCDEAYSAAVGAVCA